VQIFLTGCRWVQAWVQLARSLGGKIGFKRCPDQRIVITLTAERRSWGTGRASAAVLNTITTGFTVETATSTIMTDRVITNTARMRDSENCLADRDGSRGGARQLR